MFACVLVCALRDLVIESDSDSPGVYTGGLSFGELSIERQVCVCRCMDGEGQRCIPERNPNNRLIGIGTQSHCWTCIFCSISIHHQRCHSFT